jgi:uncharacterized protein
MNLAAVLVTGLLAGGISCAAVQGGLLAGLITRQRAASPQSTGTGWRAQLGDDLAPVAGFLAGKLVSHALLGALLGALGGAVQLSVGARTWLQIGAGLLIVVFGLAQLGVPGFRRIVVEPPRSWTKVVRDRTRSQTTVAPALLGLATVLIPCGVTLSVEALALTSGSALAGAATMAVFVLGTAPMFALLGYLARKSATVWRGRLAAATGIVVLGMGLYTLNGGLELAGSPLAASRVATAIAGTNTSSDTSTVSIADGQQTVVVTARTGSYSPDNARIRADLPTILVVKADNAQGCVRSFIIPDRGVDEILPVNGEIRIDLGTLRPGRLDYSCCMGMYTGTLTID